MNIITIIFWVLVILLVLWILWKGVVFVAGDAFDADFWDAGGDDGDWGD